MQTIKKYDFFRSKYGSELLIDLIHLESLGKYISEKKPHVLSYYDITLISEGEGIFRLDDHKIQFAKGTLIFSSPGQIREWDFSEIPQGLVLIFEEEFLCSFFNDSYFVQNLAYFNNFINNTFLQIDKNEFIHLSNLMKEIEKELPMFDRKGQHILRALLYQTLSYLDNLYHIAYPDSENKVKVRNLNEFIELVKRDGIQHHSVNYYADKLNMTSGYLNDLLKRYLKINAKKYIQDKIILEAKKMLLYSDKTIAEIAWKLNFQDTSYFIRFFKKQAGITPSSFRYHNNP